MILDDYRICSLTTMILMEELITKVCEGLLIHRPGDHNVAHIHRFILNTTIAGTDLHKTKEFICLCRDHNNCKEDDAEHDHSAELCFWNLITITDGC